MGAVQRFIQQTMGRNGGEALGVALAHQSLVTRSAASEHHTSGEIERDRDCALTARRLGMRLVPKCGWGMKIRGKIDLGEVAKAQSLQ